MTLRLTTTKLNQVAVYFENVKYKMLSSYIFIAIRPYYILVNLVYSIEIYSRAQHEEYEMY